MMRAMVVDRYGPPEVLHLREVEKPVPGPSEVLVQVHATDVAAADYRIRGGNFPRLFALPARVALGIRSPRAKVLGSNFAGVVEAVGADVTHFKAGDRVLGTTGGFGAHAEYVCVAEDKALVPLPESLTFEEGAALPFGGHTALFFLRDKGNIQPGQRVLIYGASGAVGTAAVQIAKHFGAEVTGVCSTANLELVKSLGADRVIDYTKEDYTKSGQTYDLIFETVGKSSVSGGMRVLNENGIYLANVIELATIWQMLRHAVGSNKKVVGTIAQGSREKLLYLSELVEAGEFKAVIDRSYPFEEMVAAHRYADTGRKKGNVVVLLEHDD